MEAVSICFHHTTASVWPISPCLAVPCGLQILLFVPVLKRCLHPGLCQRRALNMSFSILEPKILSEPVSSYHMCIYIFIDAISNQWNHITLSARKHPQMVSLLLACSHYSVSQFQRQRPKRATAPLNAKIVQYYGPQKIRHKMLQLSRIAKFSNELCTTVIGHKRTRLNLAHLVGSPSPRLWIWPAILHHISRLSKSPQNFSPVSRKSHRARRSTNFNQSSTLGLTIYAVLTWFCSAAGNLPHQGQMIKKGKERKMSNKEETWKTKGTRSRKRKRRKKKQQIEEQRNKRNSEQDLNWFVI